MKNVFLAVALFISALCGAKNVVKSDTISAPVSARVEKTQKKNEFGEVSIRYYLVLTSGDKTKKVTTSKEAVEAEGKWYLIRRTYDDGSVRITKAIKK